MARTHKDRRVGHQQQNRPRKSKEKLSRRYLKAKRLGFVDPGDFCPDCGNPTGFQSGFLICQNCDWIDSGLGAIEIDFNVA